MALRYANGPNPFDGPKKITLIVNGTSRQITLPPTGTWPNYQLYVDDVALDAGENTIELRHATGDDGHVNLDSLRLAPAGVTRYEAEAATLAGGANVQTEHAGYSGDRLRRRLPEPGREHDVRGDRARRRPGRRQARLRERPEPVRRPEGREPVRQRPVREEAHAAEHRPVDRLRDVERPAPAARREQRRLDPLRRRRRRQRQPRLPRRHAERADPVRADVRAGRRVRRRAGPLPLVDDRQRGSVRLHRRRRQAADRGAERRHRRRHGQRPQRRAPAGADRRQLVGDDEGVDRRHRRLHPGRARRARERRRPGARSS